MKKSSNDRIPAELATAIEQQDELGFDEIRLSQMTLTTKSQLEVADVDTDKAERLERFYQQIKDCTNCRVHQGRNKFVFGVGNPNALVMFVGEGPGRDEDLQGQPFVGLAGQLLTKIIQAIQLSRQEVYITNIIKCRPPGNRNPEPDEISACEPFLVKQLEAIRPKLICALGTFAAQTLLKTEEKISSLRGRFHPYRGISLMPTYHPAFLLRNANHKRDVWEDMKKIKMEYEQF